MPRPLSLTHSTGTPTYSPPEYIAGKPYTVQGDIYGLGVLLYQLLTADATRPIAPGWERDIADPLLREDIAGCVDGDPERRLPSAAELAEAILKPSAKIAQGFETYLFTMANGKVYTGFVVSTSARTVLIREATGSPRELQLAQIESKEIQKQSLMPEGLVSNLTPEDLADLIAYLQSLTGNDNSPPEGGPATKPARKTGRS